MPIPSEKGADIVEDVGRDEGAREGRMVTANATDRKSSVAETQSRLSYVYLLLFVRSGPSAGASNLRGSGPGTSEAQSD